MGWDSDMKHLLVRFRCTATSVEVSSTHDPMTLFLPVDRAPDSSSFFMKGALSIELDIIRMGYLWSGDNSEEICLLRFPFQ